jgi:hypothetical protein
VPNLFGSPLDNLLLFAPDFGLALVATAVMGVLWAVFRLGVAHTGESGPARSRGELVNASKTINEKERA